MSKNTEPPKGIVTPLIEETNMEIAQRVFLSFTDDERLVFMGWCRRKMDEAMFSRAKEETNRFVDDMKSDLGRGAERAEELGRKAVDLASSTANRMDNFLKKALGADKDKKD